MSPEENKAVIRRLFEAEEKRNLAILDELIAPDFIEGRNTPFELRGPEGYKQFVTMLFKGFPDWHETIEDIIAEGDKVWACHKTTGTAPSGKKIELTSINIFRIVNGKVVEGWGGVIQKMSVPKVTGELYEKLL